MTHSFPTRRSSELRISRPGPRRSAGAPDAARGDRLAQLSCVYSAAVRAALPAVLKNPTTAIRSSAWADSTCAAAEVCSRSEEHTSELQSLMRISYAVFCLQKKQK